MRHLTLLELNGLLREVIETTFLEEYWVEAELASVREVKGHCYMELVQKDERSNTPVAQASAKCWRTSWSLLGPQFERVTGQPLRMGMKVLLKVYANFHEAYGFSWIVTDLNPEYTLGDMAKRRREIIRRLQEEGVFDLQKELQLPMCCQRIAVISSASAAGYGDFCHQLRHNEHGLSFETTLFPAVMQGEQVEQQVITVMDKIAQDSDKYDVVVIIRGGGGTADLSGFDTGNVTDMYNMFNGCGSLTFLYLGSFETGKVTRMDGMFTDCASLTSLDLTAFDTSNVTYMGYMFWRCNSLETIYVGDGWTTASVTSGGEMFDKCDKIVGGDGTAYDSSKTDQSMAHYGNGGYLPPLPKAYAVYFPDTYTLEFCYNSSYNYYTIGFVYTDLERNKSGDQWGVHCADIQNVVFFDSFADARPTTTAHWFNGCTSLSTISGLKYLDTSRVTSTYAMFNGCKLLTELDLGGFDTQGVKNMGYMFNGCSALKTIYVSDGWSTGKVTSSDKMFYGCKKLVGGDGTAYDASAVDKAKAYAGAGGYLTVPKVEMAYCVYDPGTYTLTFCYDDCYDDCTTGYVYTDLTRKKAGDQWGAHRADIKKVVFNSSFANARPTSTAHWFNGCTSLTTISGLKYLDTSEVTSMYAMFNGCSVIKTIDVSKFDTSKVKNMGYMFNSCPVLTSLDLKSFDTGSVTNMNYMFNSCQAIQTIEVGSGWDTSKVTASTRMLNGCKKIMGSDASRYDENSTDKSAAHTGERGYLTGTKRAYAVYEDGVLSFYYDNAMGRRTGDIYPYLIRAKSGDLWGAHKTEVTKVVFHSSFAQTHPGSLYHWFNGFKLLTTISGIQYLNTSDVTTMSTMFNGCKALTSLDLSGFDTGKVNYMGYMFNSCTKLKTIYVSDGWTTGKLRSSGNMSYGCKALVGGDGTKYDAGYIDATKAYAGNGGYLTYKASSVKELNDTEFDTTGIDDVMADGNGDVYTLQGTLVGKDIDLKSLPKGIYVVGGKKVYVK